MISRFVNFTSRRARLPVLGIAIAAATLLQTPRDARAQVTPLIDICTGLRVQIPVLQPVTAISSGLLSGLLAPLNSVFDGLIGDINTNIQAPLSGQTIGITAIDTNGNAVSFPGSNCNVAADSVTVNENKGITLGGGQIDGLGGVGNPVANAGEINSIALGNGANTTIAATAAISMGLRAAASAVDGIAIGRDASALTVGGVALGAGSVANRIAMSGASEAFSGFAVASTAGAVSVGAIGAERQITNVAGGTQATDAVNVRQLHAVGSNLATALGGGATFDSVTGLFTGPTYVIDGNNYNDVGSALAAISASIPADVPLVANNTSSFAAPTAAGSDSLAAGYGTSAAGTRGVSIGTGASAAATDSSAFGANASALANGGVALGAGSVANRAAMNGADEAFSGATIASTAGAVSIGVNGAERQIANVAGGTQATDAVNVRQLLAVGSNLATALGGGATFDSVTGLFTGPTYVIDGNNYNDVGSALAAITSAMGTPISVPVAANNTSSLAAPTATGSDSLAVGYGTSASGMRGVATGTGASASAADSSAYGADSSAAGNGSAAFGSGATAAGTQSIAIGQNASTAFTGAIAIGGDAGVTANGAVALGFGSLADRAGMSGAAETFSGTAVASTQGAVSVGASGAERQITNVAGGTQATDAVNVRQLQAVGSSLSSALGGGAGFDPVTGSFTGPTYIIDGNNYSDVASALAAITSTMSTPVNVPIATNNTGGFAAPTATGSDSMAIGYGATASGAQSTAIGVNATASFANSTAIGAGASTTQANQMALGTAQNTYRLAGIGSAQSRAAQTGPVRMVTSDASGNLALSTFDPDGIDARIIATNYQIESVRREARQGIAAAMTMTSAPLPSQPGRTSWALNAGTFQGEFATAFAMAYRFDTARPLAVTAGYSNSGGLVHGARVGLAGEF